MNYYKTIGLLACVATLLLGSCAKSSKKYLEEEAIAALDKTTETIGNLTSVSLRIINQSTELVDGAPVDHLRKSDLYMNGANKLHIHTRFDQVRRAYWYNGSELAVFRFDENLYDIIPAPPTTIGMIDSIHHTFKIDFPAADVFYPTLTDDIIEHFDSVLYIPSADVNGVLCRGVHASNATLGVTLYIEEATNLPAQLEIYGRGTRQGEKFISFYQDWQLNPELPDEIFKFSPPAAATKGVIFKKD